MALKLGRFQFTIARLMGATVLAALAAWAATSGFAFTLRGHDPDFESWNLLPLIACVLLLCTAVGVLFDGKEGAREGAKTGCMLLFIGVWLSMAWLTVVQIFSFVAGLF